MPIVRFDPPKRPKSDLLDVARTFVGFYNAPVETILGLATSRGASRGDPVYMTVPVEVNTDTGKVAVSLAEGMKGKLAILDRVRNDARGDIQRLLQTAYDTGVVPKNLGGYQEVGNELAKLSGQYGQVAYYNWPKPVDQVDQVNEPEQSLPPQEEPQWSSQMPSFLPPGGMAGFAQMTGASKLALTRGMRRSGTSKRRKKRSAKRTRSTRRRSPKRKSAKRKLVKGSAAAKRYMASIRKKRRG